jgi:HSP20 family protein
MANVTSVPVKKEKGAAPAQAGEWSSFDRLREEVDHLFDNFLRGFFPMQGRLRMPGTMRSLEREMEPAVDLVEKADGYRITAELPGIDEKNIEVKLCNGMLMIKGEKQESKEEKDTNYVMSERRYGSFQRGFRLPEGIDPNRIEARFEKGILTVTLPKTEEARKEKKIEVKAA